MALVSMFPNGLAKAHGELGRWTLSAISCAESSPGLRGFSATALRNMRKFYEAWIMLDSNSTSALAEIEPTKSSFATDEILKIKSSDAYAKLLKKSVMPVLITDSSVKRNEYYNQLIFNNITLKDLFVC